MFNRNIEQLLLFIIQLCKRQVYFYSFGVLLCCGQAYAQTITGTVIDTETSVPLIGVNIVLSDSSFTTTTDINGTFSLSKSGLYTFAISGYTSRVMLLQQNTEYIIELKPSIEHLNEIVLTSKNFNEQLKSSPNGYSVITKNDIQKNNIINIAPILNSTSGVYMHNGTLTTNRITIRGIGSRNLFGTSKIRAFYEDIPLTNGSGASTIENLDLQSLGRIEILKGPSSSLYGSGLGGTIHLVPFTGHFDEVSANISSTFGSYGLQKYSIQANLGNTKNATNIIYSNLHSDGYRENNTTDRQNLSVLTNHYLDDNNQLKFIGSYIDLKAFIPSSLNYSNYMNNPQSAAFTWGRAKGFEDYKKGHFGLSWQHDYNLKTKQYTSVFGSFLKSYEARPFNILDENTNGFGLRTRIASSTTMFDKKLEWTVGGELFWDQNAYKTYENLYDQFPPETGSVQGELLSDFSEKRFYYNLFLDTKYSLSSKTSLSLGLNLNSTSYDLNDNFTNDTNDYSGNYSFKTVLSPKFGLTHEFSKQFILYSAIAHGFSPPSLEETLLPDGLINPNIEPESGWNFEIGSRGSLFNSKLHYDIALFKMNVKNLLVARRTDNDEYVGVNAGETTYNGIELGIHYNVINTPSFKLNHSNNLTLNDFKFKDFVDDTANYSGNDLTGVPNATFNSNLSFESALGFYGNINYNYVGKIPMRDDNTIYADSYQLVNTKVGFNTLLGKHFELNVYAGINNLLDEKYASMLLINAGSFGGNAPRYYYPGLPINYYTGATITYNF